MYKTLAETRVKVLYHLGDADNDIWSNAEIDTYLKEGYNDLAVKTLCFWDFSAMEEAPYTANYNGKWEHAYFETGQIQYGRFTITDKWEDDYDDEELDPGNHTAAWEWEYLSTEYISALQDVPTRLYQIERATNNNIRIDAVTKRQLESDSRYEYTEGPVEAYAMQYDGLRKFRKYRKPTSTNMYEVSGTWGLLRDPSDITSDTPTGSWGCPRRIDGEPVSTDTWGWGIPRRVYKSACTHIEFYRRGIPVDSDEDKFELPEMYVKYLRHYAMSKALEREGLGQDSALAKHFKSRYTIGLERMQQRKRAVEASRTSVIGGATKRATRPPKPKLPYQYGKVCR